LTIIIIIIIIIISSSNNSSININDYQNEEGWL